MNTAHIKWINNRAMTTHKVCTELFIVFDIRISSNYHQRAFFNIKCFINCLADIISLQMQNLYRLEPCLDWAAATQKFKATSEWILLKIHTITIITKFTNHGISLPLHYIKMTGHQLCIDAEINDHEWYLDCTCSYLSNLHRFSIRTLGQDTGYTI